VEGWRQFVAGSDIEHFRIFAISELELRGYEHPDGVWLMEPFGALEG
jgi:hypothetical protein